MSEKRCWRCREMRPLSAYHRNRATRDGLSQHCRPCSRIIGQEYRKTDSGKLRTREGHVRAIVKKRGATTEWYDEQFKKQRGLCAICKDPKRSSKRRLCVDHCHKTHQPRALLCGRCNSALGMLGDDYLLARAATDYLIDWFAKCWTGQVRPKSKTA